MGHPPRILSAGLFACLILLYFSPAFASRACSNVGCHGLSAGKGYQEGQTYVYDFEGTSVTSVSDAQGDSTLNLKAKVELTVKPNCIRQLRIKNAQINGAPVQLKDVEEHALQFNYHNGHIDTEVCAEPGDSQASLNIKRAVASLFQTAVMQESGSTTHFETDVFGGCVTDFYFKKDGDNLTVKKERNLINCRNRETLQSFLVSAVYDPASPIQSNPILAADLSVEQKFKSGVLNTAETQETYKFQPFSNGNHGAKTVVKTSLKFNNQKGDVPDAKVSLPKSLIFEAPHPVTKSSAEAITEALNKVKEEETEEGVKPFAARRVAELTKVLRVSNKKDILSAYQRTKSDKSSRKVLLDALYKAGTGEAAEVVVDLIKSKEITPAQALYYYLSLAIVRHVNLPSVNAITSLLDQPDLPRVGYLGVGQIIGKYCQEHECENVPEIKKAVAKIVSKVGNGKAETRQKENEIVAALKALGNTRYIDDEGLKKIATIATDKKVRNRVRVAAIEALSTRCSQVWMEPLGNLFGDYEEDAEIRIKSYLSLVECACPHVAEKVSNVLDNEKSNQVGSFVTSHLRNLRASTDPNKVEAKRQLGQIFSKKRFPQDFRKFSFNNEFSYNFRDYGIGDSIESNVIYSQNSFIPRSASLNLTSEIFGRSFNFLELNTRIENLDHIIEHYFGPKGELMRRNPEELFKSGMGNAKSVIKHIMDRIEKMKRSRREVKHEDLDKFAKGVVLRDNEVDDSLDIDLSLKMFGVEMAFLSLEGPSKQYSLNNIVDKIFDALDKGLDKLKDFNYDIENHLQFLEAEAVYPTGLGLPLTLGATGTSVIHVKTSGKIDVPSILKDPKNAFVKIALEPSASIRVAGHLAVHGLEPNVESGLKVIMWLHTSTGSDLSVKFLDGKGIDINFGIPKKKQELITVESEVLINNGKEYVAPKFGKGREHSDCFDQFSSLLGLTVCGHISYPYDSFESVQKKPFFPLSGPAKFSLTIENNDVSSYHFKVYFDNNAKSFEILLETPNSRTSRKVALMVEASSERDKYIKLSLDSSIKKASIEGILKNTPQERTVSVTVVNDQNEYYFKAGLLANGNKYKPVLEYKMPEHVEKLTSSKTGKGGTQMYNVDGSVDVSDVDGGKKFVFDKVTLKASGRDVASLDGSVTSTPTYVNADVNLGYGPEKIAFKADAKKVKDGKFTLDATAVPTKNPEMGFAVQYEVEKSKNDFNQKLVITQGPDLKSEVNRITMEEHLTMNLDPKDFVVKYEHKFDYPASEMAWKVKYGLTRNSIEGELKVKLMKFKSGLELEAKSGVKKPGDYDAEFKAYLDFYDKNKVEIKMEREILDDKKSRFVNSLELPNGKYSSDVTVVYDISNKNIDLKVDGDILLKDTKISLNALLDNKPQGLNVKAVLTCDGTTYLDLLLKVERGDKPSGSLTLQIKHLLTANGHFTYQGDKGNARINIDIPKINRKIKGTSDMTVTGTQHVVNVEILYDAEKDPSKRLKLTTVSDITKTSIDTKNVIEILSYKFEVNGNGKIQGDPFQDGQVNGELEITLPNGRYLVTKGKHSIVKKASKIENELLDFELIDHVKKGGEFQKLSINGESKDVDRKAKTGKGKLNLKYLYFNGKDIDATLALKRSAAKDTGRYTGEGKLTITGAVMPKKLDVDVNTDTGKEWTTWDVKSSLGDSMSLNYNGKYVPGEAGTKPYLVDTYLEGKLPVEKLRNFKFESHDSLIPPIDAKGDLERKHKGTITYNDDKKITTEVEIKRNGFNQPGHPHSASAKVLIGVLEKPPYGFDFNIQHDPNVDKKDSMKLGLKLFPADISGDFEIMRNPDWTDIQMKAKGKTKLTNLNDVDLEIKHKSENENKIRKTDIALAVDDKKYALNTEIKKDPVSPSIEVTLTTPEGKTEIKVKNEHISNKEFKSSASIKGPKGFVTLDSHIKLESEDDFLIEVDIDGNKLKYRKIHAEVAGTSNPKNGKRIHVTVTSEDKNLLSGSMNFNKREEEGKIIIDGSGELKVLDATRSSSFKYSRQSLTIEQHGEQGIFCTLHANFDPSAIVSELKFTNKEALFFGSYCEKNKDCTQMKLHSKLDTDKKTKLHHQVTVEANLRKLNVPLEFGFRSNMKYERFLFDHVADLYLHSTKDKSEYGYHAYCNMKESGIVFNTPNRELALIASHELPKSKHTGAYKMETALYLDRKNKPNDKTSLMVNGDVNIEKNMFSLNGEAKFIYPTQPKDMLIKGKIHSGGDVLLDANVDIDIFAKKAQKINIISKVTKSAIPKGYNITSSTEINSRGQQLKIDWKQHRALSADEIGFGSWLSYNDIKQNTKTIGILFSANTKEAHFLIQAPNQEIIKSDATMEFSKNLQKIENELKILDNQPIVTTFEAKDWNNVNFVHYHKDAPNDKLMANARIVLGQLTELHANHHVKGNKKNLFSILVNLDESNFLKTEFSYDKDNIIGVGEHYRNNLIEYSKQMKDMGHKVEEEMVTEFKDLADHLKKAQPNLKPLVEYYQAELKKLKEELHADATVQEIEAVLMKTFGTLYHVIAENVVQMVVRCSEVYHQITELNARLAGALKTAWPEIKASIVKVMQSGLQVLEAVSNLTLTYFKALLNVIKEHQKELKEIITVTSELAQDVAKMIFKAVSQIQKDIKDLAVLLAQQLKALPLYDMIKEKYELALNFEIPEAVLGPIQELFENAKNILPTKELKDFVEITYEYIMKLVRKQKVDDTNELKKIYSHAISAVQSVIELLQNKVTFDSVLGLFDPQINADLSFFKRLPGLASIKISVINLLFDKETPTLMELYYAFRPTLHALDIIPPFSMAATVTNGGHIFTFDGRHITLPGSCNYILAQDFHDGNFSVVAELNNGNLLGVTVTDPKDSITIKPKGVILYNNKPSDFPLNNDDKTKDLHAFYTPPSIHVKSSYGLHMICTNTEQLICNLHVSGFYLGKLRGLFGDGNNEAYDDFTLPSGKITESDTEFANAYKLNPSCPDVAPMNHEGIQHASVCTDYFSGYSSMSRCFNYVNPSNWRHACDHAIAAGDKDGACVIAIAYYAACREKRVFVNIPAACTKCKVGSNDVTAGDSFSVKIPKKTADIMFVVEQEANNEKVYKELIVPLISELRNELKQQGMTDVFTGLIGFGDKMKWPQHYTSNGNLNVEGEAKNMNFEDKHHVITFEEAKAGDVKQKVKFLKQLVDVELGTFELSDAYDEAIKYPFRPGSAKAVVGVLTTPCEKSPLPISLQQLRLIVGQKTYRELGLTYFHMFNTGEVLVNGKEQKNIVGYDYDRAYTFADGKKKPLEGSASIRNNLALSNNDVCASFAVSSGGAAFSTHNFIEGKPSWKKQFIQVAATRIAEGLANLEIEEECTCNQYHGLFGRPCCKIVNRKEKEHAQKSLAKRRNEQINFNAFVSLLQRCKGLMTTNVDQIMHSWCAVYFSHPGKSEPH